MVDMRWLGLTGALLLGACSYSPLVVEELVLPGCDAVECGDGERCEERGGAAVCSCGVDETAGGPACASGQSCTASGCNAPPVAEIEDDAPELYRLELSTVTLSGEGSSDPDGDPLRFSWTIAGACTIAGARDTARVSVVLPAAPEGPCTLALQVSDGTFDDEANVTLTLVSEDTFGTFVDNARSGCVDDPIDLTLDTEQGTAATPWCRIALGIEAARVLGLGQVSVSDETYVEAFTIDDGITVTGGFERSGDDLLPNFTGNRTTVDLEDERGVGFAGSGGKLERFEVLPAEDCDDFCAGVSGDGLRIELSEVFVGRVGEDPRDTPAAGIYVRSERTESVFVDIREVEVVAPLSSAISWGILIDGRDSRGVGGILQNSAVRAARGDAASYGVRLLGTDGLTLDAVTVDNELAATLAPRSWGVADGSTRSSEDFPCDDAEEVCSGSLDLTLRDCTMVIEGIELAVALALDGSVDTRVTDSAGGDPDYSAVATGMGAAIALQLTGARNVDVAGSNTLQLRATVTGTAGSAIGILALSPVLSRVHRLDLQDLRIETVASATATDATLFGVNLAGIEDSVIGGCAVSQTVELGGQADRVVGARTFGSDAVAIRGCNFSSLHDGAIAGENFALLDGVINDAGTIESSSSDLSITNNNFASELRSGYAGCIGLFGTTDAEIAGNQVACLAESEPWTGIALLGTEGVQVADNVIESPENPSGVTSVGLLAGYSTTGPVGLDLPPFPVGTASVTLIGNGGLDVQRNTFLRPSAGTYQSLVIVGPATSEKNNVANNSVRLRPSPGSTGILLLDTDAVVVHNTVSDLTTNTDDGASGIGYAHVPFLSFRAARPLPVLANNHFHAPGASGAVPYYWNLGSVEARAPVVFAGNTAYTESPSAPFLWRSDSSAIDYPALQLSEDSDSLPDYLQTLADPDRVLDGNARRAWSLCSDEVHLAGAVPELTERTPAVNDGLVPFEDFDGEPRGTTDHFSGADHARGLPGDPLTCN